jgi:LPXTG-site transpeptidase (sortase) family protein
VIRRRIVAALVGLLGIMLVVAGVYEAGRPKAHPPVSLRPSPLVTALFPTPGSQGLAGYRVKSSDLGIDLPLVNGDGWTVPYSRAALFPGMKAPGEGDRSMLYAHALPRMFGPLSHAVVGQHVDVIRPGKPTLHYAITQYFPRWSPSNLTYTHPVGHEELVLLTCTTYNANDPRILAVAELI